MAILSIVALLGAAATSDWLVTPPDTPVTLNIHNSEIEFTNALITRRFAVGPGTWGTVDFVSHVRTQGAFLIQLQSAPA